MKYKLKEHVTEEMLVAVGYEVRKTTKYLYAIKNRGTYDAVYIELHKTFKDYRGVSFNEYERDIEDDITPYIQDLIDLDYVEVVE